MRDTLGPIAEILQEAGDFEAAAKVLCEWLGVSAAPDAREAFCKLLEASPAGIACALDFSPDTKGHWFGDHKLDRGTFDRIVALATEEHRRAAVVRVSLEGHKIGGCVPAELGRLTNLTELILAGNALTGRSRLVCSTFRETLQALNGEREHRERSRALTDCSCRALPRCAGPIPESIGNLTSLQEAVAQTHNKLGLKVRLCGHPRYTGEREERTGERELGNALTDWSRAPAVCRRDSRVDRQSDEPAEPSRPHGNKLQGTFVC